MTVLAVRLSHWTMTMRFCATRRGEADGASQRRLTTTLVAMGGIGLAALLAVESGMTLKRPLTRLSTALTRLRAMHDIPTVAQDSGSAIDADLLARLVGRWTQVGDGSRLLVSRAGEIWSDRGTVLGTLAGSSVPGANVTVRDHDRSCSYAITFGSDDRSDWRLIDRSAEATCPSGSFERHFAF